jgi:uncharacterized membrane protein YraQ (UPF0718 family)
MNDKKRTNNWHPFLYFFIFLGLMVIVFYFFPDKLTPSLKSSWDSLAQFVLIFPAIILLIGIFSVMVTPEMIAKNFGKETGFYGAVKALFFGSLMSTGPLYLAFPLAKNLLDKGAKISDVIIFVSAWNGIGVIAELVELHFMGILFMAIRCLLLMVFIILMGYITELIFGRRSK